MRTTLGPGHLLPCLLLLASCSSPPKPPVVDETTRRPVNSAMAVELQVCRNDLHNTRLMAAESGRLAETTAATLAHVAARQQSLAALQATAPPAAESARPAAAANTLFTVRFGFGSAQVEIPVDVDRALVNQAKAAPLVLLRGRTDGSADSLAEARMARDRAAAVRDHLVVAGVDPARIRMTYQPVGDHVADNDSAGGRSLNRRVEIELYRALPVASGSAAAPQP